MKVLKFNINGKRILNTVLSAFFTIVIYWMATLAVQNIPSPLYFFVAAHIEMIHVSWGMVNFVLYILSKKGNKQKNMLLYCVSATLWNRLVMYGVRRNEGLLWSGMYIMYSLITLGILFFIYFIILKYLDYRRKRDNYVQ